MSEQIKLENLHCISEGKMKQFRSKGIETAEDLAMFLPLRYYDFTSASELRDGELSGIVARVVSVEGGEYRGKHLTAVCDAGLKNKIRVTWFNQNYLRSRLVSLIGDEVIIKGKAEYNQNYNNWSFVSPTIFSTDLAHVTNIYPVYSKIRGMSDEYLRNTIDTVLPLYTGEETIPEEVLASQQLPDFNKAIHDLHKPQTSADLEQAKRRMVFGELLYFAAKMEIASRKAAKGSPFGIVGLQTFNAVKKALPYNLTEDQEKIVRHLMDLAKDGRRINSIITGDVGSGKSICAFLMMMAFYDAGYQSVIMAPTQVLARQHYADLQALVAPFGIEVALIGADKLKKAEERELLSKIESGKVKLIVGTHAAFSEKVKYHNLALTVTDEEHRFGVIQREALVNKAAAGTHTITMSATPIPRTLAATVYGNGVEVLPINTMPAGRIPIRTAKTNSYRAIFKSLKNQLGKGHQAYVVCPMIDKNEENMAGVASVEQVTARYKFELEQLGYKVESLTGKNTPEETADILSRFKANDIKVLVATTVVEVGVNVPNATMMIIHNAERFGLSALHQLRGRVGRGSFESYCVLESHDTENERLDTMCRTTNGFEIAKADMEQRGAGEFLGTRQHGDDTYIRMMMANPMWYENEIKPIASELIDSGEIQALIDKKESVEKSLMDGSESQKRTRKKTDKLVAQYIGG